MNNDTSCGTGSALGTVTKKDGFWIRLWMDRERSPKTEETYEFLKYEDGYNEKDEGSLKSVAENWAEHDRRGYGSEYYRYGFDNVLRPPKEWLEKELISLKRKQESLMAQEKLILAELLATD